MFENDDKKENEQRMQKINKFFNSILQNELFRSSQIVQDFITLSEKNFNSKKKNMYDKFISPEQIKDFTTMEGYVDIKINNKKLEKVLTIENDIRSKVRCYNNLVDSIKELISSYKEVKEKTLNVFNCFNALKKLYETTNFRLDGISHSLETISAITYDWHTGYKNQINYLEEDYTQFFTYISKEIETFSSLHEEFNAAKKDYEQKKREFEKNKNNPIAIEKMKNDYSNSKICYGFILNRVYDEYYRVNEYHNKLLKEKLGDMDDNKKILFSDYEKLLKLINTKL